MAETMACRQAATQAKLRAPTTICATASRADGISKVHRRTRTSARDEKSQGEIDCQHREADEADEAHGGFAEARDLRASAGRAISAPPASAIRPSADGQAAEEDDLGDLLDRETRARIETVADRAAAQRREADIVADGEAGEGVARHLPIGKRMFDVARRQEVEAGETEVTRGGPAYRHAEILERHRANRGDDVGERVLAERTVKKIADERDDGGNDERRETQAPTWRLRRDRSGLMHGAGQLRGRPRVPGTASAEQISAERVSFVVIVG